MGAKAERVRVELERVRAEKDNIIAEVRDDNVRLRGRLDQLEAENESLRAAGRCLFTAMEGDAPSPGMGFAQWFTHRLEVLDHAQRHWLEVDPR